MLPKVLAMYIKGHIKLRMRIKLPASSEWNSSRPAGRPSRRNMAVHAKPSRRQ